MTRETGSGRGRHETAAATAAVRAWFDEHGWQLQPADLRHALRERGADDDLVVELLDEGADRRRAAEPVPQPNGGGRADRHAPAPSTPTVPPQNLEAEESVLGAIMLSPAAIDTCRRLLSDDGREFYRESHARIWRAALALHDRKPGSVDAITLVDELERAGDLDQVGGRVRLHELAALVPASANVAHYAGIVAETAAVRGLIRAGGETARIGFERAGTAAELYEQARLMLEQVEQLLAGGRERIRITAADQFVGQHTDQVGVLLGSPTDKVLPAHGLGITYGKGAAGKTTMMLTVIASLASAQPWLGIPVARPVRVMMIENEGPKAPFIEKIERYADQWDGPDFLPNVSFYDEPWGRFDLNDRGMRDDLLAFARDQQIDLVVAGPLRGLGIQGPGAPSETDAFVDLLKQAGLGTELAWWIVHHTNKVNQISGDWDRQPDLLLRLTYEGKRRQRLAFEKIRWGDQGREPLVLEWLDEGVGYRVIDTTQPDVDWLDLEQRCLNAIHANPGCSQRKVEELAGGKSTHVREALTRLEQQHRIDNRGKGNRKAFYAAEDAPRTLDQAFPADPGELEWGEA
jgi:hypothetical protein